MAESTRQSVLFAEPFSKPVTAQFDADDQSSDGGLVLLGALDRGIGLTGRLAKWLGDPRDPRKPARHAEASGTVHAR